MNASQIVQPLAQLCLSPQVQTPFLAAIFGPSGAGKTFALRRLMQTIEQLNASPARAGGALARPVLARVDASSGVEAPVAIASAAYAALDREPGGVDYSGLLDEIGHAGGDPHRAARAASDRHDEAGQEARGRALAARRARGQAGAACGHAGVRHPRLAPRRVRPRAPRNDRGAIAPVRPRRSRRRLELPPSGARHVDPRRGRPRRDRGPRAIWAYGSQARLILWGIVAFALGFALRLLHGETALAAIGRASDWLKPVADWIGAHGEWFARASDILYLLGALAIALNLWRALGFSNLLLRGARLLTSEVRERRSDLDARAARLSQRVVALTAEADSAAKGADAAIRRVGGKTSMRAPGPEFLELGHDHSASAREFLSALSGRIGRSAAAGPTPDRLIVVVDNLDALPPAAAIAWIDAAQSVIGPGAIGLLAFDPARLAAALGGLREARRRLGKWLQATINLPARGDADGGRVIARLLSAAGEPAPAPDPAMAAALMEPLSGAEAALLAALAPLAAHSPRDAKRFLNAYRLARCSAAPRPVVALMQAAAFADDDAQTAMRDRLASGPGDLSDIAGPPALVEAIRAARAALNGPISIEDARAAAEIADRYALPL